MTPLLIIFFGRIVTVLELLCSPHPPISYTQKLVSMVKTSLKVRKNLPTIPIASPVQAGFMNLRL